MYKKIGDYGIIGNLHSVALVGLDGSIDWCCLPAFDSPSVFGALLDEKRGGHFSIAPEGEWDSVAHYLKASNILNTSFRTRSGVMVLTDFMPVAGEEDGERSEHPELLRLVQVTEGEVAVKVEFFPRFDYARRETVLSLQDFGVFACSEDHSLALSCSRPGLEVQEERAGGVWPMKRGDYLWFCLTFDADRCRPFDPKEGGRALRGTEAFWRNWLQTSETGRGLDFGPFREPVERSALVLKLLQYRPTGAIAAAATTSLPEQVGGVRNWDYRFSWVRDTVFTLDALFDLGHLAETGKYLGWIETLIAERGGSLAVLYDIQGDPVGPEVLLDHLEGYKGSSPVRIGNAAAGQKQHDIYGEIMDAAFKLSNYLSSFDVDLWPFLRGICETVRRCWREKDRGIWEVRGGPYHFVSSKVLCWVALDRGLAIARRYGFPADLEGWEREREEIRREVLDRGWHPGKKAFVQHYDTDALDAGSLLLPIFGFLPYDDPRMISTVQAIRRELGHEEFIHRYRPHQVDDGLPGEDGVFLVCSFWLIQNLIGQGKVQEAERLLHRMERVSNHLGLFAEEYDLRWKSPLGNFPQALTHIGYVNSIVALRRAQTRTGVKAVEKKRSLPLLLREKVLIAGDFLLNEGEEPPEKPPPGEISLRLRQQMNLLQGAFFDSAAGRVAYEQMRDSPLFRRYVELSRALRRMDPETLESRPEKLAFWLNLFNVMVIHGVVELGIRDSVQEVPRFFRRIRYRVGDHEFSADDIEHGVLRGNRSLPHSLFRPFGRNDPRRLLLVEPFEPRIHFALVRASRSSPPIEVYQPQKLEKQLDLAAATFLNAGGARVDRERHRVFLSELFRWYADDFGATPAERLRFIAPYLYEVDDRDFLEKNAQEVKIAYIDYDWRLNRR